MRLEVPGHVVLLGLLQTAGFTGLSQWALVAGAAGKTAVLAYTMPFWLLLLAWPLLHERLRGAQWLAMLLAAVGLVLILAPWQQQPTLASALLAVASGLCWALSAVLVKKIRRRSAMPLLALTAWQLLFGAVVLAVIALVVPTKPTEVAPYLVFAVLYTSIIGTGFAWLLWMIVLDSLPAGIAGLGSLAIPAVGVLAAWLELREQPPPHELGGMLVIAVALLVLAVPGLAAAHRNAGRIAAANGARARGPSSRVS
jgi:drug/metabolite transporter (DMT)-like permease